MTSKTCKNSKCHKVLPIGYKHKYCEQCRSQQAYNVKKVGKLTVLGIIPTAITIVTLGKIRLKK